MPSKEQEKMKMEQHTMPDPRGFPLSGPADGSDLCFMKVPLPKMGKSGDREINHFVFIHLNRYLNSPLGASTENAKVREPCPVSS